MLFFFYRFVLNKIYNKEKSRMAHTKRTWKQKHSEQIKNNHHYKMDL